VPKPFALDDGFDIDVASPQIQDELTEHIGRFVFQRFADRLNHPHWVWLCRLSGRVRQSIRQVPQ
jgi:hypothetical protein